MNLNFSLANDFKSFPAMLSKALRIFSGDESRANT